MDRVTRCVRRAFMPGDEHQDCEIWIEHRLQQLADIFAISVGGLGVLENRLHLLGRLDPKLG